MDRIRFRGAKIPHKWILAMPKHVPVNDNDDQPQSHGATTVDRYVGSRIRERRIMLGLSQQQLAGKIGVTYQQTHKYERGVNRISAGRLFTIARILGLSPEWFFEGMQRDETSEPAPRQRMALELARNFSLIENASHQEALSQMARSLASAVQPEADNRG
jgi:transcriptional regulator with XRE-family HTH domain